MAKKLELKKEEVMVDVNVQSVNLTVDREPEVVVDKNPLHTKYEKYIRQAKDGFVTGFEYPMAMEVLRWIEGKRNIQLGLNMSCGSCIIDMLRMFDNMREI